VAPERDVVLEERRMRTDSDPGDLLNEAVQSALFTRHPYGLPVIGWADDIAGLGRADALAYYERFYTPENAILVVAGDVEPQEVVALAGEVYGKIPARGEAPKRWRVGEPKPQAHRQVTLADEKVEQPSYQVCFLVPSYKTAPREAEALEVLAHYLGSGQTSLLFRTLVVEKKLAVSVGAYYGGTALDDTRFYFFGMPAPGVSLETLDEEIAAIVAGLAEKGIEAADVERAKSRLVAETIYAQDNQAAMAQWYGASLATGLSLDDIQNWPARIEAITPEQVLKAAHWLDRQRGVTGFLLPAGRAA
jgi:zinc protease